MFSLSGTSGLKTDFNRGHSDPICQMCLYQKVIGNNILVLEDICITLRCRQGCTDTENGQVPDTEQSGKQYMPDARPDPDIKFNCIWKPSKQPGALAQ